MAFFTQSMEGADGWETCSFHFCCRPLPAYLMDMMHQKPQFENYQ